MSTAGMESAAVQVVVRMRPLSEREKKGNTLPVVTASTEKKEIVVIRGAGNRQQRTTYNFDNVLGTQSSQEEVFQQTIQPVIPDVLGGFECTMFAYGQTGTGKTHTMEGTLNDPELQGVIPRAAEAIFESLGDGRYRDSEVTASYLEIYNEELADLLVEEGREMKLQICEDTKPRGKGLFVQNLSETVVKTPADVLGLMQRAQLRRQVGETKMNKHSSRSHCLFTLKVHSKKIVSADGSVMECTGKLHLVDLAGSECAKTAGNDKVDAAKERERKNINQSLLTLGRVISALREGGSNVRIPYRDSKLTRLLQESLGGRCKTVIIATVSPSVLAVDESISTLNYAQAAHGIQNKPVATSYLKLGDGQKRPETAGGTVGAGLSCQDWNQMECRLQYLQAELEEAQAALSRKHLQQQAIIDRAEFAEKDRDALAVQLLATKEELGHAFARNSALVEHVKLARENTARVQHLVEARKETEDTLTSEASEVLSALTKCVHDGERFHKQLVQQAQDEAERRKKSQEFCTSASSMLGSLGMELSKYAAEVTTHLKTVVSQSKEVEANSTAQLNAVMQAVMDMERHTLEHSDKARKVMAAGVSTTGQHLAAIKNSTDAHGEQLMAAVNSCQAAVENRMTLIQQQVRRSEEALSEWSTTASAKLEATSSQLILLLQEHRAACDAGQVAGHEHLIAANEMLREQKASLEAMAADLANQRCLQRQMSDALLDMSELCGTTSSAHAESARLRAQGLSNALAAQQNGQLDVTLEETLSKARTMAKENATKLDDLAGAQKDALTKALAQQVTGTINEVHSESIRSAQALVQESSVDHISQLQTQCAQLQKARDDQHAGNAQVQHSAAIEELRASLVEKLNVKRHLLTTQKTGLEESADSLEAQKADEAQLVATLEAEGKRLRQMVSEQKAMLEAQAQLLDTQKQELAATLAAQKALQEQMVGEMKEKLAEMVAAELHVRAEADAQRKKRAKKEAERLKKMLEEEERLCQETEAAAKERQHQAITALENVLLGEVTRLATTMDKNVTALVSINEGVVQENSNVCVRAGEIDTCMVDLQQDSTNQVRTWGQAVASVQAKVRDMSAVNTELEAEVGAVDTTLDASSKELQVQTAAWGKSNDAVEQAMIESITKNAQLVADVNTLQEAVRAQTAVLQQETEEWRESNHTVIVQMNSIVAENEGIAAAVSSGASAVDKVMLSGMEQVQAWGDSDRTCQAAIQTAVDDIHALANTVQADQDTLHQRQIASQQQLSQLSSMTEGSQATVQQHDASNVAVQAKAADLETHINKTNADALERIAAIENVQSSATSAMTTSVADMMAPRAAFVSTFMQDGQGLLSDMDATVDKTSGLVSAQQASLESKHKQALADCESTEKTHVQVLTNLDTGAVAKREAASAAEEQTKIAMAVGPTASSAEADALGSELSSLQNTHAQGSADLSACVEGYCTAVAKMLEVVEPAPALGSFNTSVTFCSTAPDESILADFAPAVDMSDIAQAGQQPMLAVLSESRASLDGEPAPADASTDCEGGVDVENDGEPAESDENVCPPAEECAADANVEKAEKKRARVPTPKKSTGRQSVLEKPASKIPANSSSRLAAPKSRASLREIN